MGCRCTDMRNCLRDISSIEEIRNLFFNIRQLNENLSEELSELNGNCWSGFTACNMPILMVEELRLNEDVTALMPNLIRDCDNKIEALNNEYNSMSNEDYDHHHKDDDDDKQSGGES